ncbi:MAG: hypothetical protein WBY44_06430, partial [Bryobacteraceae bacterium]
MGIEYSSNWSDYSNGHLTSQATATKVINSAAEALKTTKEGELLFWSLAAVSTAPGMPGSYLEVFKADHQESGIFDAESHLTCAVWVKKSTTKSRHSLYGGAFHLFFKALDPTLGKTKYELQPNKISYKSMGHEIKT